MAAEDELALPQVPEAKPDDPEDVSWSLSTAEAMWARGDHLEGIKWVRKAAEAASEVEDDERALELAKAASDLATIVARRSRASMGATAEGGLAGGAPPEAMYTTAPPMSGPPVSAVPHTTRSHLPPAPSPGLITGPPPPVARSSPPIPLPSMASQPPRSSSPYPAPSSPRAAPRALATEDARQGPQVGRGILSNRAAEKTKARRRSRDGLENEVRTGVVETAPMRAVDNETAERALNEHDPSQLTAIGGMMPPVVRARRRSRPEPEPTIVARMEDIQAHREKSVAEWDASPTENLTGDELPSDGDRTTTAFSIPAALPVVTAPPPVRAPQTTVHDPEIQTSQAVRVVVWRDANGVHVAPAGTVVSSITIDAVLVVLEEGADLTAWLSQRER